MKAGLPADAQAGRARSILLLVICQTLAVSVWFAGSASVSAAVAAGDFPLRQAGLLSSAVQLGFVAGTLALAVSGAADRLDPRLLFGASCLICALTTAALIPAGLETGLAIGLRFSTGFALAGVYPVGMKMVSSWSLSALGLPMGLLVGALTVGSAMPNLFVAADVTSHQAPILLAAAAALTGMLLIGFVRLGPHHAPRSSFRFRDALGQFRRPEIARVSLGYLGHMWELYAMWTWIAAFLHWSAPSSLPSGAVNAIAFTTIAIGSIGCVAAGWLADRVGKLLVIRLALLVSGTCAATIGLWSLAGWLPVLVVAHLWGVSVIADSGNLSALTSERVDRRYVGTVLALQVSAGFLVTFVAIQSMSFLIDLLSWRFAFAPLAIGPLVGLLALRRNGPRAH